MIWLHCARSHSFAELSRFETAQPGNAQAASKAERSETMEIARGILRMRAL